MNPKHDPCVLVDTPIREYLPHLVGNMNTFSVYGIWGMRTVANLDENHLDNLLSMSQKYRERCYNNNLDGANGANADWECTLLMRTIKFHKGRESIITTLEGDLEGNK